MKHCAKIKNLIVALSALAAIATLPLCGCTREGNDELGFEFLPNDQRLEMRHKSFKAGVIRKYDSRKGEYVDSPGHQLFKTTLFRTDSLVSSNLENLYFGAQRDPKGIFGLREAGFASQFVYVSDDVLDLGEEGFGYLPIFDSMRIILSVTDQIGDTLRPVRYEFYEVTGKSIPESMAAANEGDTIAYINHDMSDLYDPSKPLFTFTFPDPENGIYPSARAVTMQPVDLSENGATWNFVKRLMLVGDIDKGWDGYAKDMSLYEDAENWVEKFKGVYIKPADDLADGREGSMYATDITASGFYIYGRNRNPEEPRLIKDSVYMGYRFYTSSYTVGHNSINAIRHDYTGSKLEPVMNINDRKRNENDDFYAWRDENRKNHVESSKVYIEGMGGTVTELYFTDDFLRELRNISAEEGFSHASINQALMYIYLDGSDYDWQALNPAVLTPLLDASHTRLGIYTSLESLSPISDYNYYYESTYNTQLNYDGYLKRSLGCYMMDISGYIQNLKNYVDELNPDADDNFVYEGKFNASDDKAVTRTLYIAPEAYSQYTMMRNVLQGMESADNNAPIRLELTYTMIK